MSQHHHFVLTHVSSRLLPRHSAPLALRLDAALQGALPSLLDRERVTVARIAEILEAIAKTPNHADAELLDSLVRELQRRLRVAATASQPLLGALALADRAFASERPEIMDAAWAPLWLHAAEMRWLDKLNRHMANYARWQALLLDAVRDVPNARIEDVAAGGAGFLLWVAQHSPRHDLHLTASDYSADYVALGRKTAAAQGLSLHVVQRDATQMAELAGQVDLIVCTQATHHMAPGLIARLLHQGLRAATQGVLVIDVLRSAAGLLAASLATNLSTPAPPLMLDAMQSVRRGFLPAELALLAHLAGARHVRAEAQGPAYAVLRARI